VLNRLSFRRGFAGFVLVTALFVAWFSSNLFYTLLWTMMGNWGLPITEAELTTRIAAQIAAHLLPFLLTAGAGVALYFFIRAHNAAAAHNHEGDSHKIRASWASVPVTEANLAAYIRSSPLVRKIDDQIAANGRLPIDPNNTIAFPEVENAELFGVSDVAELDSLLAENQEAVLRLSSYTHTENRVLRGAAVNALFHFLGAQLGEEKLSQLNKLRRLHDITPHGMQTLLNAYREFGRNHTIKVRVPLVADFNLVPIEEALGRIQANTSQSAFARTLPHNQSRESALLSYFEHVKTKMRLFGSLRGNPERMLISCRPKSEDPMLRFFSPMMQNPRFDQGKIIVDSQLFDKDAAGNLTATNVIYERLYVLRPDVTRIIDQLNDAPRSAAAATSPSGLSNTVAGT
jgi:hypothetical protein